MSGVLSNPEIIRNFRAQLRPGRMLVIALISAVFSVVMGLAFLNDKHNPAEEMEGGLYFLWLILGWQVAILALGGALGCGQSIQREKQMNTFDFQRVTRLTPWELTLGKLLGATVVPWFIVVCLMPAAVWAAIVAHIAPQYILAAYVVMIVGSLTYQAGALLLSLADTRDAGARLTGIITLLVVGFLLMGIESEYPYTPPGGRLTPFFALAVVDKQVWRTTPTAPCAQLSTSPEQCGISMVDLFYGRPASHFLVFLAVNLVFTGWFLLGVARNIKRDPAVYEVFTPAQSLGFAMYLNVLLLGFVRWNGFGVLDAQTLASVCEIILFFLLGMMLLRNRDQVRRRLRQLGARATDWLEAAWPAPYVLAGKLLAGLAVVGTIELTVAKTGDWNQWSGLLLFRLAFLTFWLLRDLLYFQWMSLRRGRRSRTLGFAYWIVYYSALSILLAVFHVYEKADALPYTSILIPWPVFAMDASAWAGAGGAWILALGSQVVVAGVFVALTRRRLFALGAAVTAAAPAAAPSPAGD